MAFNITLYIICLILFSPQVAIYSIIYSVFCGLIVDRLHQQNIAVMAWVFSKRQDDALRDYVTGTLHRSVTYWARHWRVSEQRNQRDVHLHVQIRTGRLPACHAGN